jgi:amidase
MPAIEYQKVLLRRLDLRGRVAAVFRTIDVLLIPVHPFAPLTVDVVRTLGEQPELIAELQRYICPFDMTGNPTITLPGGFTPAGLPIGFQLVAGHLDEATLIRAGAAFQGITSWHRRHPIP